MSTKKEIIRFFVAGPVVGVTDFGVYYLLINFLSFSLSKAISFICASIAAYLFNKYWIFHFNQPSYSEIGRYTIINFLALGINVLTNQSLLNVWPGAVFLALILASMLTGLFTFIFFKWWVFKAQ
ncbi:MAG: GtrA family protein [Candidatus Omnitrophica bacterium]|nr:GtrA family protein [Candidatus Omnitrophota bacterium]